MQNCFHKNINIFSAYTSIFLHPLRSSIPAQASLRDYSGKLAFHPILKDIGACAVQSREVAAMEGSKGGFWHCQRNPYAIQNLGHHAFTHPQTRLADGVSCITKREMSARTPSLANQKTILLASHHFFRAFAPTKMTDNPNTRAFSHNQSSDFYDFEHFLTGVILFFSFAREREEIFLHYWE